MVFIPEFLIGQWIWAWHWESTNDPGRQAHILCGTSQNQDLCVGSSCQPRVCLSTTALGTGLLAGKQMTQDIQKACLYHPASSPQCQLGFSPTEADAKCKRSYRNTAVREKGERAGEGPFKENLRDIVIQSQCMGLIWILIQTKKK